MATINGKEVLVAGRTLLDYLESEGFDTNMLAVELNGVILKRGSYGDYVLNEYDKVEIVCFVGGG